MAKQSRVVTAFLPSVGEAVKTETDGGLRRRARPQTGTDTHLHTFTAAQRSTISTRDWWGTRDGPWRENIFWRSGAAEPHQLCTAASNGRETSKSEKWWVWGRPGWWALSLGACVCAPGRRSWRLGNYEITEVAQRSRRAIKASPSFSVRYRSFCIEQRTLSSPLFAFFFFSFYPFFPFFPFNLIYQEPTPAAISTERRPANCSRRYLESHFRQPPASRETPRHML